MKSTLRKPKSRQYAQTARAESAEATGQRIVDAFLALFLKEWLDEITLDRVAADAGVTVQTVVRRFGGKEGLLAASISTMGKRVMDTRAAPRGDIGQVVTNLLADYEDTGDAVLRLLALEQRHPSLKQFLKIGRDGHREWVTSAFEGELNALSASAKQNAVDTLVVITDVYTWKLLRRDMGHSVAETKKTLASMIRGQLAAINVKSA